MRSWRLVDVDTTERRNRMSYYTYKCSCGAWLSYPRYGQAGAPEQLPVCGKCGGK